CNANVGFSNRPSRVKRFQAIHQFQCRRRSRALASLRTRHQGPSIMGCRAHRATTGPTALVADRGLLCHLPELVQRAQIIRPWLVYESLRPVAPRPLAEIEVPVAAPRKPGGAKNSVGP